MTWRRSERRLLDAGKQLDPRASANRERMIGSLSTASALALTTASVKAAISLELSAAVASVGGLGLSALGVSAVVGGSAGAVAGLALDIPNGPPLENDLATASRTTGSSPSDPASGAGKPGEPKSRGANAWVTVPESRADDPSDASRAARGNNAIAPTIPGSALEDRALASAAEAAVVEAAIDDGAPNADAKTTPKINDGQQRRAIAALDAARIAVNSRDVSAAERSLAEYDKHRGNGTLDPEAALLRLRALSLRGQRAQTAALAAQWLKAQPQSPYANTLRALIEENQP